MNVVAVLPALPQVLKSRDQNAASKFTSMTTIATFFSSITATTLQFSLAGHKTVNAFWFISLVFSIASAVYSLLALMWYQSSV